jgi:G3E family GTPase
VKKPIIVVTGCLGSGKTTLLKTWLKEYDAFKDTAVIVNEYGKVGLDHYLLRRVDERTILMEGGCICCSAREDLEEELTQLLNQESSSFQKVIIETTGMADPAPILFTINTNPLLQNHFYVQCVISTVDAVNGMLQLKNNPELIKQVVCSDKVIITKTDIAPKRVKEAVIGQIRSINPACEILESIYGDISPEIIDQSNHHNLTRNLITNDASPHQGLQIKSISFTFKDQLDWTAFGMWLSMLLHAHGEDVLRVKGLLDVGEQGPIVLNGVQHIIHQPDHLSQWPTEEKYSYCVFIVRTIDPNLIRESLQTFQFMLGSKSELIELKVEI